VQTNANLTDSPLPADVHAEARGTPAADAAANGRTSADPLLLAVEIETFSACNRACSYCPNADYRRPTRGYMETSLYHKIVEDLAAMGFRGRLSFHFYNEPLLDRRLAVFVKRARSSLPGVYIKIFTNGDRLTPGAFRELTAAGVDRFWITQHEGRANRADELLTALSAAELAKVAVRSHTTLDLSNRAGLLPLVRRLDVPLTTSCALPTARMTITLNGNVVLCCEDYHEQVVLGNVAEESVYAIWTGPGFRRVREQLERGNRAGISICKGCSNVSYTMTEHAQKLREFEATNPSDDPLPTTSA